MRAPARSGACARTGRTPRPGRVPDTAWVDSTRSRPSPAATASLAARNRGARASPAATPGVRHQRRRWSLNRCPPDDRARCRSRRRTPDVRAVECRVENRLGLRAPVRERAARASSRACLAALQRSPASTPSRRDSPPSRACSGRQTVESDDPGSALDPFEAPRIGWPRPHSIAAPATTASIPGRHDRRPRR